jgi:hypothetical protein
MGVRKWLLHLVKPHDSNSVLPESAVLAVMIRLSERIGAISSNCLGFPIPDKVKTFPVVMYKKKITRSDKTCFIEGRQHSILMMVRNDHFSWYMMLVFRYGHS